LEYGRRRMNLKKEINHAIEIYKTNRYTINSERNMDVDNHNVQEVVKKGRTLLICDCENGTDFCNSPTMCRHRLFFILYPLLDKLDTKIGNLILEYNVGKSTGDEKTKRLCNQIINDLNELKGFKL
jgi:hypothetical protein